MCSSAFSSNEWQNDVTAYLFNHSFTFPQPDYRRFFLPHLHFLNKLCQVSIESTNDSINRLTSSLLITDQLLTQTVFQERIDAFIIEARSSAPETLSRLFDLLRTVNRANTMVSAYGTNFEYIAHWHDSVESVMYTQPVIYNDDCSCGKNSTCTSDAQYFDMTLAQKVSIDGLKIGCTPSESFLASTLECFYNASCIYLLHQMISENQSSGITRIPLSLNKTITRFPIDSTVSHLINHLFNERWTVTVNYSSYFEQCSPMLCSYSYVQTVNSLYTLTYLFGLLGGLMLALKWICPIIIYIGYKLYQGWNMRRRKVAPIANEKITTIEADKQILEKTYT